MLNDKFRSTIDDVYGNDARLFLIWEYLSYAWSELGLDSSEYQIYACKLKAYDSNWRDVERVMLQDVCASFAIESFLLFPCCLWMILTDWGYNEAYLKGRMKAWYAKSRWRYWLNPIRWLGYVVALIVSYNMRKKLKLLFNAQL